MSKEFFDKVQIEMNAEEIDFRTEEDVQNQILIQNKEECDKLDSKKKKLLEIVKNIDLKTKIRVDKLTPDQLTIDRSHLIDDMDRTMILHSHIFEDIDGLQSILEELKIVQNSLICILHHGMKYKNKIKLKGSREIETYMASDYTYNELNMRIKKIQSLIEKENNYSGLIRQKLNFLRDVIQLERSKMYKDNKDG